MASEGLLDFVLHRTRRTGASLLLRELVLGCENIQMWNVVALAIQRLSYSSQENLDLTE